MNLHVLHTFFVHFFAVVLHYYNIKLPETSQLHILLRKCSTTCSLVFYCRSFSPWWPLAFLIFSPSLQNFHVALPTKKSLLFFILCCSFLLLFFTLSLAGLLPTFSFFCVCLSLYSKFVDMTINLSLILQTTLMQKQFPLSVFVIIDSLHVVVSASQHGGGQYGISCQNKLELHLG